MNTDRLKEILVLKSLRISDIPFELSSGKKSNVYIDCKKTTCNAEGKVIIGKLIYEKIAKQNLDVKAIGGLTLGSDPIANAVSYTSEIEGCPINTFIVRKKTKEHGLKKVIEGDVEKGDKVIIVDDVVTTGKSTIQAIDEAREFGLEIVKVIVLVDREEGGKENIRDKNVDFEALVTKQELLDEKNKSNDTGRAFSEQSAGNDQILRRSSG